MWNVHREDPHVVWFGIFEFEPQNRVVDTVCDIRKELQNPYPSSNSTAVIKDETVRALVRNT
jgi:hypothetical protein